MSQLISSPVLDAMNAHTFSKGVLLVGVFLSLARTQDGNPYFPAIAGWTFTAHETVYVPDNLWDLIDGAADVYLEYNFVDLHLGTYTKGKDTEIRVEIYRHATPADAFGMYAQERNPKHAFISIGVQAYREEGVLNFLTGVYYVKIMTHQRGQHMLDAMTAIAKGVDDQLKQANVWPAELTLLPVEGKRPNSDQYITKSFLGYSFLHSAYAAQYGEDGRTKVFLMKAGSRAEAKAMFDDYLKTVPGGIARTHGETRYQARDPYNGTVDLLFIGEYLVGVTGCPDQSKSEAYLQEVKKRIADRSQKEKR
jgi:hypothetical protein